LPTIAEADEIVPRILNLKSRSARRPASPWRCELNRPSYEKGQCRAALYEQARTLASSSASRWSAPSTGGGSDGISPRPTRTRSTASASTQGRGITHYEQLYHLLVEPGRGLLYGCIRRCDEPRLQAIPDEHDDGTSRQGQGSFFGGRKGHKLRAHQPT